LYSYKNASDGFQPSGIVVANGSVYAAATWGGGQGDQGTIISLNHASPARWTELTLRDFNQNTDGYRLNGLVSDAADNLYGTTLFSAPGVGNGCGTGMVYKLSRDPGSRNWSETVLYAFQCGINDGAHPTSTVTFDTSGNLYGTTNDGGLYGGGTVFKLTPNANGTWSETKLWDFEAGATPYGGVTLDSQGNLYGTTLNSNTVYKLTPSSNGQWTRTVLHQFFGPDGFYPYANLVLDADGNIYGTTYVGGGNHKGVVFKITP
jgi:uncharacterized repeat protein (TIGR03803 family)